MASDRDLGFPFWLSWSLWCGVQIALLAMLAAGVRLSAGFPLPVEDSAQRAIPFLQLLMAAVLAPTLLRNRSALLVTSAAALPLGLLATLLAGRPASETIGLECVVFAWLWAIQTPMSLHLAPLRTASHSLFIAFFALCPVLFYLSLEFGGASMPASNLWFYCPTVSIFTTSSHFSAIWPSLLPPITIGTVSIVLESRNDLKMALWTMQK